VLSLVSLDSLSQQDTPHLPTTPLSSLPVGLQIMGPKLGEEKVLMVGHVFEQAMQEKDQCTETEGLEVIIN
jgi:Asp-tRNA(Asn)/Glu-tRNA(Gln) amidotransferase A subunit family amidase